FAREDVRGAVVAESDSVECFAATPAIRNVLHPKHFGGAVARDLGEPKSQGAPGRPPTSPRSTTAEPTHTPSTTRPRPAPASDIDAGRAQLRETLRTSATNRPGQQTHALRQRAGPSEQTTLRVENARMVLP